ncbi:hypothetical protein N0P26_000522 [Acinetobacter baumannii]|uniref:Uncharacterized protein n=1 Tax=Acinetobacter baumannii TaxID=470 RepID=A0A9P2P4H5_ACIBA|nr:hypothetical protein [Acinetobacter baumannii]EKT7959418.1 hypothetical protein [Acinetobacter baumannii]EKT9272022.1 hypothetical protein [Acinetobacter baumannii]EKT9315276.1 hypothetical protein [Acinetobacter baumannii]EKU0107299.1 hypothetical protein [Acinetobacter baumannii]EKU0262624.1 hypothetical protein [Acinetobacter baumannii]
MKNVSVGSTILVVLSIFGYSSNTSVAKDINKIDVKDCSIDYDEVDFCSKERLKDYNNILKNKVSNFDKNKFLMNFKEKNYLYFTVIDLEKLKVFTFPASLSVISNIKPIEFLSDSNSFCLNGDFNQYRNSYRAVKTCYTYNNGSFDFKSRVELDKGINKYNNSSSNNVIKKLNLPISSDFFSKCNEKNSAKKCTQLENSNNRAYSLSELRKISPDFINVLNDKKVDSLNVNTFRFLPQFKDSFYSIAEKYIDTDESSNFEFYLIKIKPELEVKKIGDYYSIDSSEVITYKDENGKILKKNLK